MAVTRVTITVEDRYNQTTKIVLHFPVVIADPSAPPISTVLTLLNAVINPRGIRVEVTIVEGVVATAAVAAYNTANDRVVIGLLGEAGEPHIWSIGAPKPALFSPVDTETLIITDPSPGFSWIEAMKTNAVGSGGGALTVFNKGYRSMQRKLLKS